jgi:hypothetical protein
MDIVVNCSVCGRSQTFAGLVPFRAECDGCAADLHTCATCRFHDRFVENECREDQADPVAQKDRRNLCEYWKPRAPGATDADPAAEAKARLAAMFGAPLPPAPSTTGASGAGAPPTPEQEARRRLEELFRKKP